MFLALVIMPASSMDTKVMRMEQLLNNFINLRKSEWDGLVKRPAFSRMTQCVHAEKSEIHGMGLFASEDLPEGVLASLYPVDALGDADGFLMWGNKENRAHFSGSEKARRAASGWYRVGLSHPSVLRWGRDIWVDANPSMPAQSGWLGHYANDAASICDGADDRAVETYYGHALAHSNCVLIPMGDAAPLLCIVTTSCIARGQELLIAYGHEYWQPGHVPSAAVREASDRVFVERSIRAQSDLRERYGEEVRLLEEMLALDRGTPGVTSSVR